MIAYFLRKIIVVQKSLIIIGKIGIKGVFSRIFILANCIMKQQVMLVTGAGQISMAIARRMGYGMKIVMGDKNMDNANNIATIMNNAGFDVVSVRMDLSFRESILQFISKGQEYGDITMLINGAGVSPS